MLGRTHLITYTDGRGQAQTEQGRLVARDRDGFVVLEVNGKRWNITLDVGSQVDLNAGQQQRVQQWLTGKGTKRDAERKLTALLHHLHRDAYGEPSRLTVGEWLMEWWETAIKLP